jgi:hypothetical protein
MLIGKRKPQAWADLCYSGAGPHGARRSPAVAQAAASVFHAVLAGAMDDMAKGALEASDSQNQCVLCSRTTDAGKRMDPASEPSHLAVRSGFGQGARAPTLRCSVGWKCGQTTRISRTQDK